MPIKPKIQVKEYPKRKRVQCGKEYSLTFKIVGLVMLFNFFTICAGLYSGINFKPCWNNRNMNTRKLAYSLAVIMVSYDVLSKNAPLSTFKIRNRVSRREIILALFTVVPKVTPVL